MTGMRTFGDPGRFEIAARWVQDSEPRCRLPKEFGWSMGELRITVGGVVLTEHRAHGESRDAIQWYLGPVVFWLVRQWKWLMHEESYVWQKRLSDSAAITVAADLERYICSEYDPDREIYKAVREWWGRHALRSADASALYPDIFIRRVDDNIEVSWLDGQPEFLPEGFTLNLNPGTALFPVEEVARPLWEFLQWAVHSAQLDTQEDQEQVNALRVRLDSVRQSDAGELEAAHIADAALRTMMENAKAESHWMPMHRKLTDIPVVEAFDAPALMFGGLNVSLGEHDVRSLFSLLMQHRDGTEAKALESLVSSPSIYEFIQPYAHGYELAYRVRESLQIDPYTAFVDIEKILEELGVTVREDILQTDSVRGVAIAGVGFSPAILVNLNSRFNKDKHGRRFTLAHEFCHTLYDRSSAKRLSHISGPWAAARVEKRANAFAAMLLATPHALSNALKLSAGYGQKPIEQLSEQFGVGPRALREHMVNLDLLPASHVF
jgi:Zn-dependent peptidase ImmA (M78 family)